jgi:NAD(P)-dependent dehydrogenase (short-subunit alcohol dehydrogenase family)
MNSEDSKVAVVTGAGSGIGLAIAKKLATAGYTIVAADVATAKVEALAQELQRGGARALAVTANLAKREDAQAMIDVALKTYGRVDVLVNNAGIMDGFTPLADLDEARWQRVMSVNLEGALWASQRVLSSMLERQHGVIVNIASVSGLTGGRAGVAYTTSKHALIGLTRSVAWQYGTRGVRCVAVCPGAIDSGMQAGEPPADFMEKFQLLMASLPAPGATEDIANVVNFLVSDEARYINGSIITADGAWMAG